MKGNIDLNEICQRCDFNQIGGCPYTAMKIHCSYYNKVDFKLQVMNILENRLADISTLKVVEYSGNYYFYSDTNCVEITKAEYLMLKEWLEK